MKRSKFNVSKIVNDKIAPQKGSRYRRHMGSLGM